MILSVLLWRTTERNLVLTMSKSRCQIEAVICEDNGCTDHEYKVQLLSCLGIDALLKFKFPGSVFFEPLSASPQGVGIEAVPVRMLGVLTMRSQTALRNWGWP